MKRLIYVLMLLLPMVVTSAEAKKKSKTKLPYPLTELATMHDSIVHEGYQLYLKERIAWTAEDVFFAECAKQDMLQGMLIYGTFPVFSDIFYNLDSKQCFFEVKINVATGMIESSDSIRSLTDEEIAKIELQDKLYSASTNLDVEISEPPMGCTFNMDWIQVDDNRYRVFVILGCNMPHMIPWGNDLSYDCDSLGNILDVRKYHHSAILIPTVMDGQPVREVFHSHTDLHPLITSTDIALFLLYGEDLQFFKVYSQGVYYMFDKASGKIHVVIP